MKRKLINLLFALIFLTGLGIFAYPAVSDQWNAYRQSKLISTYEEVVAELEPEDYSREWGAAHAFNDTFAQNDFTGDAFGGGESPDGDSGLEDTEYWKVLNAAGNGVMGYLTIPKIDVRLSIYHGTADDILQTGIGHVSGTKLPIGGDGTHSVLAAHRGLPSAKLFTDLDRLEPGDRFYIHILDEVLAYEDYVTLLTCTPYGVNSHRLLVRGSRTAYSGEEEPEEKTPVGNMVESIQSYYMLYLVLILAMIILMGIFIMTGKGVRRKKDSKRGRDEHAQEKHSDE